MKAHLFIALLACHAALAKSPNIVYLLTDQWRAQATGYAGDPNVKTPNLDRLAKESINFKNAVSVAPACTPYRASLMTGRYPTSTGMFLNDASLPDRELCMAEIFSSAGYSTAYIGKWHLDGRGRESFIPPERRQGWQYWKAAECDHNYNKSHYYANDSNEKKYWEGYDAFSQTKDAQQYLLDHAKRDKPFILVLSYGGPHFPHGTAPKEFQALYPPESIKLPPNVPEHMQAEARAEAQGYYAHCTALDKCIGDIMATLSNTGLAENTIVVFTSDHGEMLGSKGCAPKMKQVPWAEAAGIPFLLRLPSNGNILARVSPTPLTTPDILPTLLGLTGVSAPKSIEGDDLSKAILSNQEIPDRAALYMSIAPFVPKEFAKEYRAIRTSRYTYVRGLDGPWLFYDDEKDPYQMDNLAMKPEHAALQQKLDAQLQGELKKIGDDFRPAKSYLDQWGFKVAPMKSVPYGPKSKAQEPQSTR